MLLYATSTSFTDLKSLYQCQHGTESYFSSGHIPSLRLNTHACCLSQTQEVTDNSPPCAVPQLQVPFNQRSDNFVMMLAILFSVKTIESLENGYQPYSGATPMFSMRTELLASSQSCGSIDADALCKRALNMHIERIRDAARMDLHGNEILALSTRRRRADVHNTLSLHESSALINILLH